MIFAFFTSSPKMVRQAKPSRTKREGDVITVIESDARVDEATIKNLMGVQDVLRVISMPKF